MSQILKKKSVLSMIRRGVQILAFIFIPGLFTSTFYAIRSIYQTLLSGSFQLSDFVAPFFVILATIPLTFILGRFFCGFFCSFGSMGDFIWFISRKTLKPKFKMPRQIDEILKYGKYAVLIFLVVFAWTLQLSFLDSSLSPWTVFGMYASIGGWPSAKYMISIGGLLLLLIMIGSFFIERFFCRYLCPLGGIYAIISQTRLFHIKKDRNNCGNCKLCTVKCTMGIPLYEYDKVTSGECINCFNCVDVCPKKNATATPEPALTTAISVVAITGLVYAGNAVNASLTNSTQSTGTSVSTEQSAKGNYTDGTYTGTGTGFRGDTTVEVEVTNGYIKDITITSYQDDQEYFNRAKSNVISEIIKNQSTDVSAVSGATYSSKGIMEAVANALNSSAGTQTTTQTSQTSQSTTNSDAQKSSSASTQSESSSSETQSSNTQSNNTQSSQNSSESNAQSSSQTKEAGNTFTDGTYSGSGTGFRGATKVSVIVSGGKISDIEVISYQDDNQFFNRAKSTVISEILKNQSVDVTAVSGATFSSKGIMEAVANALGVSFTNSNSSQSQNGQTHAGPKGH